MLIVSFLLSSCSATGDQLVVGAAASLGAVTEELADAFERKEVRVVVAGTPALLAQLRDGANFDVLMLADRPQLAAEVDAMANDFDPPVVVATNSLVVAAAPGNPGNVQGIGDLAREDVLLALGAEGVPIGEYAREALMLAGVEAEADTLEASATALVSKLELGEIDAAIVYATDVQDTDLDFFPIDSVQTAYLGFASPAGRDFLTYVLSAPGQGVLDRFGFGSAT